MPKLTDELAGPLKLMQVKRTNSYPMTSVDMCMLQDSARRIARVTTEAKIELDEEQYVESFRPHIMDVVHAWSSVSDCLVLSEGSNYYFPLPREHHFPTYAK